MSIVVSTGAKLSPRTALDMIKRARRLIGALAVGETLEDELANDGLEALNSMLASWSLDELAVYVTKISTHNLTGVQSFSIGTGGTFNVERPDRIEAAFITVSGNDYPLQIIDNEQWNAITEKDTTATIPAYLKYDATVPLGNISLFPIPTGGSLTINSFQPLQTFTNLTDVLVFPNGYERAIASNLAIEIAPETGKQVSQELAKMARESKAAIMRINARMPVLGMDSTLVNKSRFGAWQLGLST
jgi:hypothetical protein